MTKPPKRGRPPSPEGGKTEYYSARMTPALLQALQAEANRRGMSVSATAEDLIASGLKKRGPSGALLVLIERLSEYAGPLNDPYRFAAFRTAVAELLDMLQPTGEIVHPSGGTTSPEENGHSMLTLLILDAHRQQERGPYSPAMPRDLADALTELNLNTKLLRSRL